MLVLVILVSLVSYFSVLYFLFVFVWLSAPVQSIAWKDSSPKCLPNGLD